MFGVRDNLMSAQPNNKNMAHDFIAKALVSGVSEEHPDYRPVDEIIKNVRGCLKDSVLELITNATHLRKNKHEYAALWLSRLIIKANPGDNYAAREYGYCLLAAVGRAEKDALAAKETRKKQEYREWAEKFIREWVALPIPAEEDILLKSRAHYVLKITGTERHLAEAYLAAEARYSNAPSNIAALREYGWILYDCLVQACDRLKSAKLAQQFQEKLQALAVPEGEAELSGARNLALDVAEAFSLGSDKIQADIEAGNALSAFQPLCKLMEKHPRNIRLQSLMNRCVYALSKQLREAPEGLKLVAVYGVALRFSPDDMMLQTSLAWEVCARLKDLAIAKINPEVAPNKKKVEKAAVKFTVQLLRTIGLMDQVERTSPVYHQLLLWATKASERGVKSRQWQVGYAFLDFVEKWDLANLSERDYQPYESKDGIKYPSLCEILVPVLYRAMKLYPARGLPEGVVIDDSIRIKGLPPLEWGGQAEGSKCGCVEKGRVADGTVMSAPAGFGNLPSLELPDIGRLPSPEDGCDGETGGPPSEDEDEGEFGSPPSDDEDEGDVGSPPSEDEDDDYPDIPPPSEDEDDGYPDSPPIDDDHGVVVNCDQLVNGLNVPSEDGNAVHADMEQPEKPCETYVQVPSDPEHRTATEKAKASIVPSEEEQEAVTPSLETGREWVADFIGLQVVRYPHQEWFPYYHGKALTWAKRYDEARGVLMRVARMKQSQFWVWGSLADLYSDKPRVQIALLARAFVCPVEEDKYLNGIRRQIQNLVSQYPEFGPMDEHELAREADNLLLADLPAQDAILETVQLRKREGKSEAIIGVVLGGLYTSMRVDAGDFEVLQSCAPGTPLTVRMQEQEGKPIIVAVDTRHGGKPWDLYPSKLGVVTGWDRNKKVAYALFGQGRVCQIDCGKIPEAAKYEIGTVVELKIWHDPIRGIDHAKAAQATTQPPPGDFCKKFHGNLVVPSGKSFGFVGDIYVSAGLVEQAQLDSGISVEGLAVISTDRKTLEKRWRAITAKSAIKQYREEDGIVPPKKRN